MADLNKKLVDYSGLNSVAGAIKTYVDAKDTAINNKIGDGFTGTTLTAAITALQGTVTSHLTYEVFDVLPTDVTDWGKYQNKIILVKVQGAGNGNIYDEYLVINAAEEGAAADYKFEKIGSTELSLTGYAKTVNGKTVENNAVRIDASVINVDDTAESVETLKAAIERLENADSALETALSETESALQSAIDSVSDALEAAEERISADIECANSDIASIKSALYDCGGAIHDSLDSIAEKLSAIDNSVSENSASISDLLTSVGDNATAISNLCGDVSELSTNLEALTSTVEENLASATGAVDELAKTTVSNNSVTNGLTVTLGGTVEGPTVDVSLTEGSIAANNTGLVTGGTVYAVTSELETAIGTNENAISALESRATALETAVSANKTAAESAVNDLATTTVTDSDTANGITVTLSGTVSAPEIAISITEGSIAESNTNVVTGGTVYTALEAAKSAASNATAELETTTVSSTDTDGAVTVTLGGTVKTPTIDVAVDVATESEIAAITSVFAVATTE